MSLFKKKPKESRYNKIDESTWVDRETGEVITAILPISKARRIGRALMRQNKLKLFLFGALLLVCILFIIAMMQEKSGNFTINLDRLELFRKGIAISSDAAFTNPTAKLTAEPIENVTNIASEDIPENVDQIDGDHSGRNYLAYTYYIRNAGKENIEYTAVITMDSATKGAEYAVRVGVWQNGEKTVYAMPSADGSPEEGCVNFEDGKIVCRYNRNDFNVGNVDKYTVAIWLDGDDPECVDAIVGGALEFTMRIASAGEDDSSLLEKFVQDIRDTLSGNDPIGAAGTENNTSQGAGLNWYNRNNQ